MSLQLPAALVAYCHCYRLVGSRVTCSPAPTDTDQDVLCWVKAMDELCLSLEGDGWEYDGDESYQADGGTNTFHSYRRGEVNLILTEDLDFYDKFLAATSVAKRLNLLDKEDRVALFQAVLYGQPCTLPEFEEV